MGTPRFSFETNCPDGQKCGATTTGCIVGHCQRKGTATCKHMLNLQAGESHVLSYACPYCKNEELESKLAALEADARRYRWLREHSTGPMEPWSTHSSPESLDAAIDAALSQEPEGK